jgi:glycosyltransferase involved in cell wall biosynthesis
MIPAVSVIIPTFNRRAMMGEAVASVLAQRGAEFELIVVDDGSTDGTWRDLLEIAARANERAGSEVVRGLRIDNRGAAAARNAGAALASGEYLAFLDSDDLWRPDKLNRQLAYMRANPAFVIAQCEEIWLRRGRRVNPGRRHRKAAGDIFERSLRVCLISPSAVIIRREIFRADGGFDTDFRAAEDYDLWLRLLARHDAGLLDEPLVIRRAGHPGQLSATVPAIDRFRILALMKLLARSDLSVTRRAAVCAALAEKCSIYAHGLYRRERIREAGFIGEIGAVANGVSRGAAAPELWTLIDGMRALIRQDDCGAITAAEATQ